jgi:hypothetical protein
MADKQTDKRKGGRFRAKAESLVGADSVREGAEENRRLFDVVNQGAVRGRMETFDEARDRLGASERDIQAAQTREKLVAFICAGLGLFMVVYGLYLAATAGTVDPDTGRLVPGSRFSGLMASLASLCMSIVVSALAYRAAFRNWQIRNRRLGGLEQFLASPKNWLPK